MNRTKLAAGILASAVVLLAGIGVGTATAAPKPAVDPQAPTIITLPFLSAPVTLTVVTGPGGNIVSADLDTPDAFAVGTKTSNKVNFVSTDGALQVSVKSKGNEQRVTARAGELATLLGTGKWSGDVFGDGFVSTVDYTVGDDGAGNPTLTKPAATPGDATITAEASEPEMSVGEEGAQARASVVFTKDGQSRTLSIKVSVHTPEADDDDEGGASLRISLGKLRGVAVVAADAAGPKTWTGKLCDGTTTAKVEYVVNVDGTLTFTSVDPTTAEVKQDDSKLDIRFSDNERVRIRARLNDGQITVSIDERIRCRDAADPTTNVTNTIPSDDEDDDEGDDHGGDHHDGGDDEGGDHHGGDDHGGGQDD
jgi:hypothetical protein